MLQNPYKNQTLFFAIPIGDTSGSETTPCALNFLSDISLDENAKGKVIFTLYWPVYKSLAENTHLPLRASLYLCPHPAISVLKEARCESGGPSRGRLVKVTRPWFISVHVSFNIFLQEDLSVLLKWETCVDGFKAERRKKEREQDKKMAREVMRSIIIVMQAALIIRHYLFYFFIDSFCGIMWFCYIFMWIPCKSHACIIIQRKIHMCF